MIARLMGLQTISPAELRARSSSLRVFDVNALASWQVAHVPGACHLEPDGFERGDLPAERDAALVFYCSGPLCRKAPRAAKRAREFGYTNVSVMSAGIRGWIGAGMPAKSAPS